MRITCAVHMYSIDVCCLIHGYSIHNPCISHAYSHCIPYICHTDSMHDSMHNSNSPSGISNHWLRFLLAQWLQANCDASSEEDCKKNKSRSEVAKRVWTFTRVTSGTPLWNQKSWKLPPSSCCFSI